MTIKSPQFTELNYMSVRGQLVDAWEHSIMNFSKVKLSEHFCCSTVCCFYLGCVHGTEAT